VVLCCQRCRCPTICGGEGEGGSWLANDEERLCDKIIRLGPDTSLAAEVRQAEKFSFDAATTTRVCAGLRDAPAIMVEAAIPDLDEAAQP
jgi:hypothetical protein